MTSSCRSGSVRRLGRLGGFILLLALLAALAAVAAPAAMANDGAIEGTVTIGPSGSAPSWYGGPSAYPDGTALNDIVVFAFAVDWFDPWIGEVPLTPWADAVDWAVTNTQGYFKMDLPPGDYYLWFEDPWDANNSWIGQWYDQLSPWNADPAGAIPTLWDPTDPYPTIIEVTAGVTEGVLQSLTCGSWIQGFVEDNAGDGVPDIQVYVYAYEPTTTPSVLDARVGEWIEGIENQDGDDYPWITPDAWTNDATGFEGEFFVNQLNPTTGDAAVGAHPDHYVVYFHDPSNALAPQLYWRDAPWDWPNPDQVLMDFGDGVDLNDQETQIILFPAASIAGTVTSWMNDPIEDALVEAYSTVDLLLATPVPLVYAHDWTDSSGDYLLEGLHAADWAGGASLASEAEVSTETAYAIKFSDPDFDYYQTEWFNSKPVATQLDGSGFSSTGAPNGTQILVANAVHVHDGEIHGNVDASLNPTPDFWSFSPTWGVTNNPDPQRPPFVLTLEGQGLNMVEGFFGPNTMPFVILEQVAFPYTEVVANDVMVMWEGSERGDLSWLTAEFDLVATPVPAGNYRVFVVGAGQFKDYYPYGMNAEFPDTPYLPGHPGWNNTVGLEGLSYLQLINVTTPVPPPVDPYVPAPTPPTPPTPTPTPTPTVVPIPTPTPTPVAGAITTKAPSSATVKRGKIASLKYRVNEAVLGGSANVTIKIKKSGVVVKTLKIRNASMNSTHTAKFTCKLAKGKYTFYVSATTVAGGVSSNTASNRLTVK